MPSPPGLLLRRSADGRFWRAPCPGVPEARASNPRVAACLDLEIHLSSISPCRAATCVESACVMR